MTAFATGCEGGDDSGPPPYAPHPDDAKLVRGWASVQSVEIRPRPGRPDRFQLILRGNMPTPCHSWRASVSGPADEDRIDIELYSVVDPAIVCIQVIGDFEGAIELPPVARRTEVRINGERVGFLGGDHQ
ncbi:MAG: hypothetical protein NZ740_02420 [Kiritimatiellae bacterium]|nr:hypothetical protein [Kiritimatiellia bacterium]MDW8457947.1 hypothetical protein [Verrucomicrobiota bacterium]